MVRNRNPCLVEAQRGFCETHHIFMKIVLPADLTECKAEFFYPSLFPQSMRFLWCAQGACQGFQFYEDLLVNMFQGNLTYFVPTQYTAFVERKIMRP